MKVGIIDSIQTEKHPAPVGHPENPKRMRSALDYVLQSDIASDLELFEPELNHTEIIRRVHQGEYLDFIKKTSLDGITELDPDTYISQQSYSAAEMTAQAAMAGAEAVMTGKFKAVFMAGRPPGHHAERNRAMGFCLINNAAVAAEFLSVTHRLKKIAIIDWDVHHGNGTQNVFYDRSDIFYISLHHYPFFPGTGARTDIGTGQGKGYTLNIPLPPGSDDEIYLKSFSEIIIPALNNYKPEFIIISCGFDAHKEDPLGGMNLTEGAFGEMTRILRKLAVNLSKNRILSVFEGGYSLKGNSVSLYKHLQELITDYE